MKLFLLLASALATVVVAAPADTVTTPKANADCKKCSDFYDGCRQACGWWPSCQTVCNCKTHDHEDCKDCGYACFAPEAQADNVEETAPAEIADILKDSVDVDDFNSVKKDDNIEEASPAKDADIVKETVDVKDVDTVEKADKNEADISGDPMCHMCRDYYQRCREVSLARYRDPQDLT
jgi:hypothetical protein